MNRVPAAVLLMSSLAIAQTGGTAADLAARYLPELIRLDCNLVARILFLAEALDRHTRAKGQHGRLLNSLWKREAV